MKRCSTLLSGLVLAACARSALAADGCSGDKPWVAVSGDLPAEFADAVRSDLRAGLAPSSIEVCQDTASKPTEAALAHVSIAPVGGGRARYNLEVTDSVTQKRVARRLSLEGLPADGRAFALAVAAEELLRASWAELALRGVHSAQTAAPPEVRAIVADAQRPPPRASRLVALGARLGFEHFTGGQTHYGADLFGVLPVGRVAAALVAFGARRALSTRAPHGDIGAGALSIELGASGTLLRRGGLELGGFVSGRLLRMSFEPEAAPGASADSHHGFAVTSRLGLSLAFGSRGLLRCYNGLGVGLALKSFSAADAGRTVTGASDLELFASSGLALELP